MENWTSLNQKACRKDRGTWHIAIPFGVESNLLGRTLQTSFQLTGTEFKPAKCGPHRMLKAITKLNPYALYAFKKKTRITLWTVSKPPFGDSQFSWHWFKHRLYGCFLKWWYPQIIHFNEVSIINRDKSSILGSPYFRKHPYKHIAFLAWFNPPLSKSPLGNLQSQPHVIGLSSCQIHLTIEKHIHPGRLTWITKNYGGLVQINFLSFHGWFLGAVLIFRGVDQLYQTDQFDNACVRVFSIIVPHHDDDHHI